MTFGDLILLISIGVALWYVPRYLWRVYTVKTLLYDDADVMSYHQKEQPQEAPSSLRQTELQTDRPPAAPVLSRDVMLDMYRLLREHGVPREKARPILKAANIPLDNNLWTQAAPTPSEPVEVTPIAGRPTNAKFHQDDPELEYKPLR